MLRTQRGERPQTSAAMHPSGSLSAPTSPRSGYRAATASSGNNPSAHSATASAMSAAMSLFSQSKRTLTPPSTITTTAAAADSNSNHANSSNSNNNNNSLSMPTSPSPSSRSHAGGHDQPRSLSTDALLGSADVVPASLHTSSSMQQQQQQQHHHQQQKQKQHQQQQQQHQQQSVDAEPTQPRSSLQRRLLDRRSFLRKSAPQRKIGAGASSNAAAAVDDRPFANPELDLASAITDDGNEDEDGVGRRISILPPRYKRRLQRQPLPDTHVLESNHSADNNSNNNNNNNNTPDNGDRYLTYDGSSDSSDSSYLPNPALDDASSYMDEETMIITGRRDTKRAAVLRTIVILLFLAMAVGAPIVIFRAVTNSQQQQFQQHFESNLYLDHLSTQYQQWMASLEAMRVSVHLSTNPVTAAALQNPTVVTASDANANANANRTWPFQTVPNFEYHSKVLHESLSYTSVSILPVVATAQRNEWERFAVENHDASSSNTNVDWYPNTIIGNNGDNNIQKRIWNITQAPSEDHRFTLPTWQSMPSLSSNVNLNQLSVEEQTQPLLLSTLASATTMTQLLSKQFVDDYFRSLQFGKRHLGIDNASVDKKDHPMMTINVPVTDTLTEEGTVTPDSNIVAVLTATVSFDDLLHFTQSDDDRRDDNNDDDDPPVMVVVENTCGDIFSYEVNSMGTTFLGLEDAHHSKYDSLERSMTWEYSQNSDVGNDGDAGHCIYSVSVFPTTVMEESFTTSLPLTLAVSLAVIVIFIAIMAFTYDYFVQRRMWNAVRSARESRAIVSSLFPANVRDRLLQEEEEKTYEIERNLNMTQPLRRMSMSILGGGGGSVGGSVSGYNNAYGGTSNSYNQQGNAYGHEGAVERHKSIDHTNGSNNNSNSTINYNHNARRRSNDSNGRRRSNESNSRRRSNDSGHRSNSDSHPNNIGRRNSMVERDSLLLGVSDMLVSGAMAGFAALAPPKLRLKFELNRQQEQSRRATSGHPSSCVGEDDDSIELALPDKPIADLFPHCTVLFSDISGFTAWSSEREPEQVFTLLQTIFQSFDMLARKRNVYKVETIGDCYVAVTGCPDRQDDHAVRMTKFARECLRKVSLITKKLEVKLGPGTGDLAMRFGLHSGPVTAGVLRGEKSRFQLFGDTVNTASRMESTGMRNRIHISQTTADLLLEAGKANWISARPDVVHAKGKGAVQTYWVLTARGPREDGNKTAIDKASVRPSAAKKRVGFDDMSEDASLVSDTGSVWGFDEEAGDTFDEDFDPSPSTKYARWIDWQVDLLSKLLKQLIIGRTRDMSQPVEHIAGVVTRGETVVDEVSESINMPRFDARAAKARARQVPVTLPDEVVAELREYVTRIASLYRDKNPFHNFAHASHVCMSASKLLSRIVKPEDVNYNRSSVKAIASDLHDYTYGITSDPLTHFAVMFSALIHDVDHFGVSNAQVSKENPYMAQKYKMRSVAEQNSIDIAWDMLMDSAFSNLQKCLFADENELVRFRQMVVNMVISTDIFDKAGKEKQKRRWDKAFHPDNRDNDLKASIVIESIIQAADVAHTMQHWQVYTKWNERLFQEMYKAYECGRAPKDPSIGWYQGELWFFDNYIIPLARKLERCGIFGVSIDECLNYAVDNRKEWAEKGESIVQEMVQRYKASIQAKVDTSDALEGQEGVVFVFKGDDTSSNKSTKASTDIEDEALHIDMTPTLKPKTKASVPSSEMPAPELGEDMSIEFSEADEYTEGEEDCETDCSDNEQEIVC